jgi:hypothetical protein
MRIQLWRARGIPAYLVCQIDEETGVYLTDDDHSMLVQTDWDFPSLASAFGWSMRNVQSEDVAHATSPCRHSSTDGTITCGDCKLTAGDFINSAREWLDENIGKIVEDCGYF